MASYIPMNEDERREMMDTIGISSLDEMYVNILLLLLFPCNQLLHRLPGGHESQKAQSP